MGGSGQSSADSPWGTLTLGHFGGWTLKSPLAVVALGELALEFEGVAGEIPTPEQFALLEAFLEVGESLRELIEGAVFGYYQGVCEVYREGHDPDWVDKDVPVLSDSAESGR